MAGRAITQDAGAEATPRNVFRKALNYVRGAVDAGQFVPIFKSFAIASNTIQGSDGVVTLNAPVECDLALCVDANKFVKSILACTSEKDEVELSTTATGNVRIKQGKFRAIVPVIAIADDYPWARLEGVRHGVPSNLLQALKALRPFIGTDATKPWAMGVLIRAGQLYATNNVCLVRAALIDQFWNEIDDVVIPTRAVDELLRIGVPPRAMLLHPESVTFMHSKLWWMKTQRINLAWPNVGKMIDDAAEGASPRRVSDELRDGVQRLQSFAQGTAPIYLLKGSLTTSQTKDDGASIDGFEGVDIALSSEIFKLVLSVATHLNTDTYPKPMYFVGTDLSGMVACMLIKSTGPEPTQPTKNK